ncbi:ciliary microtubule-associated protein 3 isoform X2 [Phascolarctos cinereus]|uniref:Protein pitchfork isoform X2 n=1 Tax=Phascolarctos cinereus TaxID=38626 RepID=A0A6P5LHD0_PHACI|nr:protein pitchfork isoform X2 [Phascolarctos cinereus]
MNWEWQLTEAQLKYCFGSCQPRKIFPIHHPPNRIGNKNVPLVGAPHRGPGCYLHEEEVIPKAISPDSLKIKPKCAPPSYAPFNSISNRFDDRPTDSSFFPGPGTYNPETMCCRKVTWPMKFGSPDWAQVPVLKKRTLKTELITDKEFRIHRNREAYLSLYYS